MSAVGVREAAPRATGWHPVTWHRGLLLALSTIWVLDGVLQLQPFMFRSGADGFSGMLAGTAAGNPTGVARSITWNANLVDHHAVVADALFAVVQLCIGLGIAWRPTVRLALGSSVVWSLGVWWFGEGLGGILHGAGTPLAGGPGAVLFYALLAVLLWPRPPGEAVPFAAAGAVGARRARIVWVATWTTLAVLALLGAGRAADEAQVVIRGVDSGQPGWLATLDRTVSSALAGHGFEVAVAFAVVAMLVGAGVYLPAAYVRVVTSAAVLVGLVLWVVTENFGMILAGGATDPNSGPVIVLLALAFWPVGTRPVVASELPLSTPVAA